jgi:hypothetical protein
MYLYLESVLHLHVTEKGQAEEAGQENHPEADVPLPGIGASSPCD